MIIGIDPTYDYLYDPQRVPAVGFCKRCGGEIYHAGDELCERCKEAGDGDEE